LQSGLDILPAWLLASVEFDEEKERGRLRKMSDEELIRKGKAARYMCAPSTNFGKPPRDVYVVALRLCKEGWRRRNNPIRALDVATMKISQSIHTNNPKRDGILFVSSNILCPAGGSMVARYDIFKETDGSVLWVEAVEDIVKVKKRLISLASQGTDDYRVWDSTQQQFVDVLDDCA
jgi:hypothetical protein